MPIKMKTIEMQRISDGVIVDVPYDPTAPCIACGNPVVEASMGGPELCGSCDCGYWRTGKKWDIFDPEQRLYILKAYRYLRKPVFTFQEVHTVAELIAARGVHVPVYEAACVTEYGMNTTEGWFGDQQYFLNLLKVMPQWKVARWRAIRI